MTEHSYSSPAAAGQAPTPPVPAGARRSLLASGLLSLITGGLLLTLLGFWSSLALDLPPAAAGRALLLYGCLCLLVLLGLPGHLPLARFGPANGITLLRGIAACWLAALIGQDLATPLDALPAAVAAFALLLDACDGWAARRGGWATAFGARFDMECDAFFLAVIAALAVDQGRLGPWVLLAGALRYLFVAAGWRWSWLRGPLAPRWSRKAAYAIMAAVLVASLVPDLPGPLAGSAAALALALLAGSFLRDVRALRRRAAAGDET
ncbi:Phosphatidylglycerophosphate synthase [Tistlia consotensis]|uniref:Phosphatidylglycerophosphate synthase n=1 Tax=Tistlia consotensis USBA 355 TaxID=560819 RepID=A0A1Y6BHN2_9PROT|nr:CDP-alcohol phosphatidyltransferase family protein [Tistlia consotensis]SMF11977.1 Phosphatidylglycerophosphate synthase [Tistlia consotensis USBA 355]SNR51471.1 Phosphatidylglycerophosphate synthase [Tistlia consotensis]